MKQWGPITVAIGLVVIAVATLPLGAALLLGLVWLVWVSM